MNPEDRFYELKLGKFIPEWAYQKIEEVPRFTSIETKPAEVPLAKLVGTSHFLYCKLTWLNALMTVARKEKYTVEYVHSIDNEVLNKKHEEVAIVYIEEIDKYYILAGNHRMILVKLKGEKHVYINNVVFARLERVPLSNRPLTSHSEPRRDQEPTGIDRVVLDIKVAIRTLFRGKG